MGNADLRRAFRCPPLERALPQEPRQGPDRPLGRLRSPHPDRLRPRRRARPRRGGQGRRLDRPQGRHAHALRRDPARRDEHVDDDQRHRGLAAGALRDGRGGERGRAGRAGRHDPERHHQGVPLPRHLRLPARALDAADRRHGRLHRQRDPELEPDQRLLLPPAGGGSDAGTGDRLRPLHRHRRARRGQGPRPGLRRGLPQGLRPDLLLRQRRRPLHRGARQAPRHGRDVGVDRPQPLRGDRAEVPAPPLRRPGQLPRPDRVPAREQRSPDRARSACGDHGPRRPCPGDPAAGLERGARPPPPLGSAVEPADPADPGQRDRPARVPRHLRGLEGDGRPGSRTRRGCQGRDEGGRGEGRRGRGGPVHEGTAGRVEPRADRQDRAGRDRRRRAEQVHGDRGFAAHRR